MLLYNIPFIGSRSSSCILRLDTPPAAAATDVLLIRVQLSAAQYIGVNVFPFTLQPLEELAIRPADLLHVQLVGVGQLHV